jgi:hypothetical protein
VIYRLGTTFPGWLTSASTRRVGIVTLTDLTRTLIDFDRPASAPPPLTVDGSPLAVYPAELTVDGVEAMLRSVAALSDAIPAAYLILGSMGAAVVAVGVVSLLRRRLRLSLLMWTVSASLSSAMLLTGARAVAAQQHAGARPQSGGRGRLGDRHGRRPAARAGCSRCRR